MVRTKIGGDIHWTRDDCVDWDANNTVSFRRSTFKVMEMG